MSLCFMSKNIRFCRIKERTPKKLMLHLSGAEGEDDFLPVSRTIA